ncbi:MAG: type IV pilus assembly protein PilV [Candidatus Azotimanducaceae bacterium]|jgi:type IV pilus assembly protein PilV
MLSGNKESGFTIVEVLVSMLVLAVGVLGVTGLQLRALDSNRDALFRSEAGQFANDIIDRIDVNAAIVYGPVALGDAPPAANDCRANVCTPAQMALFDIATWLCSINSEDADGSAYSICGTLDADGGLPNGSGSIIRTGNEYEIIVSWQDVKSPQTSTVTFYFQVQ